MLLLFVGSYKRIGSNWWNLTRNSQSTSLTRWFWICNGGLSRRLFLYLPNSQSCRKLIGRSEDGCRNLIGRSESHVGDPRLGHVNPRIASRPVYFLWFSRNVLWSFPRNIQLIFASRTFSLLSWLMKCHHLLRNLGKKVDDTLWKGKVWVVPTCTCAGRAPRPPVPLTGGGFSQLIYDTRNIRVATLRWSIVPYSRKVRLRVS